MSYGQGVGMGMAYGMARRAESESAWVNARADDLERENSQLKCQVAELKLQLEQAKRDAQKHFDQSVVNSRLSSAGWVVMNGTIRAMQDMSPVMREAFRSEVVRYAQDRIDVLDQELIGHAKQYGYVPVTIMSLFKVEENFKTLGFKD